MGKVTSASGTKKRRAAAPAAVSQAKRVPTDYAQLARPFDHVFRDKRGGAEFDYFTGEQSVSRLNEQGPGFWSFDIIEHGINEEADEVWVLGKATFRILEVDPNDPDRLIVVPVTRMQFGSQKIKRSRTTRAPMDIGFDLKGAATDAEKKCAAGIGVGLYLWRKDGGRPEIPDDGLPVEPEPETARSCQARETPDNLCGAPVPMGAPVMDSMREFNRPLCPDHLQRARDIRTGQANGKSDLPSGAALAEAVTPETLVEDMPDEGDDPGQPEHEAPTAAPTNGKEEYNGPGASAAPTKPAPARPATTPDKNVPPQVAEQMKSDRWPCSANRKTGNDNSGVPCDAVLRRGTGEDYNGRTIRAEQIAEASLKEFARVLCGRHLHQAREHRRKRAEAILGA